MRVFKKNPFLLETHTQIFMDVIMLSMVCIKIIQKQEVSGNLDEIIVAAGEWLHRDSLHCRLLLMFEIFYKKLKDKKTYMDLIFWSIYSRNICDSFYSTILKQKLTLFQPLYFQDHICKILKNLMRMDRIPSWLNRSWEAGSNFFLN